MKNESSALRLWLRILAALLTLAFSMGAVGDDLDSTDGLFDAADHVSVDLVPDDPGPAAAIVAAWTFPPDDVSYPSHHPLDSLSALPREAVLEVAPKRPPPSVSRV